MLLLLFLGAVMFYLLQEFLYRRYWKWGLNITIGFETRSAFEGESAI